MIAVYAERCKCAKDVVVDSVAGARNLFVLASQSSEMTVVMHDAYRHDFVSKAATSCAATDAKSLKSGQVALTEERQP